MKTVNQVQILDKAAYVSLFVKTLEKDINPSVVLPALDK